MISEYLDPIYDQVKIEEDLLKSFFSNKHIGLEIQRAKGISNLGLVKYIFPAANHSKFEHHLGTYKLITDTQDNISYLNQNDIKILKYLNFFSCFGYFPFAYCSSEALILAASAKDHIKNQLIEEYLGPVYNEAKKYEDISDIRESLITSYSYKALNAWFGGLKLYRIGKEFKPKRLHKSKLLFCLIDNRNKIKKAYFDYATVEYLQRDLFYTGVIKFRLPTERVFINSKKFIIHPEYREIVDSMRATINRQVYTHPKHIALESKVKEILADLLCEEKISIKDLMTYKDSFLEQQIDLNRISSEIEKGHTLLNEHFLFDNRFLSQSDDRPRNRNELYIQIAGNEKRVENGFVVSTNTESRLISYNRYSGYSIMIDALENTDMVKLFETIYKVSHFLIMSRRLQGVNVNGFLHKYMANVLKFLFKKKAKINHDRVLLFMQNRIFGIKEHPIFSEFCNDISDITNSFMATDQIVRTHILSSPNIFKGKRFAFLFEYLLWSEIDIELKKKLAGFLYKLFKAMTPQDDEWNAMKLEFEIFLYYLLKPTSNIQNDILCPSVQFFNEQGDVTHEIDFIRIAPHDDPIKMYFYECSKGQSSTKCSSDMNKIKNLVSTMRSDIKHLSIERRYVGNNIPSGYVESDFDHIVPSEVCNELECLLNW